MPKYKAENLNHKMIVQFLFKLSKLSVNYPINNNNDYNQSLFCINVVIDFKTIDFDQID